MNEIQGAVNEGAVLSAVNDQLFIDVLTQIEREPELWNQGSWIEPVEDQWEAFCWDAGFKPACGTAFCFAGHVANLDRVTWYGYQVSLSGLNNAVPVARYAMQRLGIDPSSDLFLGTNTLDDLYRLSAEHMGIDEQVLRDKCRPEGSVFPAVGSEANENE